jgi:hypothetical protein
MKRLNFGNPLTRGLVAYYAFDEKAGDVLRDRTGCGNNADLSNVTWIPDGLRFISASSSQGYADNVRCSVSGAGSLFMKVKITSLANNAPLLWTKDISNSHAVYVRMQTDSILNVSGRNTADSTEISITSGADIFTVNQWFTFIVTWDSASAYLYVDGVLAGSDTGISGIIRPTEQIYIASSGVGTFGDADVCCCGVYSRKLTALEVYRLSAGIRNLMTFSVTFPTSIFPPPDGAESKYAMWYWNMLNQRQ